ncbi:uncharacterized protein LOC141911249 [Tubulanus polymorphus]|uniref:uncharacterized protein LOC141911249 n=1 Tax=Tubulanus polymorphus TaxID=672921 RepID=UPI003DA1FFC3
MFAKFIPFICLTVRVASEFREFYTMTVDASAKSYKSTVGSRGECALRCLSEGSNCRGFDVDSTKSHGVDECYLFDNELVKYRASGKTKIVMYKHDKEVVYKPMLGGYDLQTNSGSMRGPWVWRSDNTIIAILPWHNGEPNYRHERCIQWYIDTDRYNDIPCNNHNDFLCQYNP